ARDFETQQRIEGRAFLVLQELLKDDGVTHLSIVCHSQGTVIVLDVLGMHSLADGERTALKHRLGRLQEIHLITMRFRFTHIYQYYSTDRYPALEDKSWKEL